MNGFTIHELSIGQKASFAKTVTETDVVLFAGLTGDFNPVHLDAVHAATTRFGQRIVHGMFTASLIATVFGVHVPGPGAIYASQSLRFLAPVFIGDTVRAEVEVAELDVERNRARFVTRAFKQDGSLVAEGESLLLPRKA